MKKLKGCVLTLLRTEKLNQFVKESFLQVIFIGVSGKRYRVLG